MNYGLHLNKLPNGRITFVGSIPIALMNAHEPTRSDIMGGRVIDGLAYSTKVFDNVADALAFAKQVGITNLCQIKGCACRSLFTIDGKALLNGKQIVTPFKP